MKNNKRHTLEFVIQFVNDLGFNLISDYYLNAQQKLILKDNLGYLYSITYGSLAQQRTPSRFHKNNPFTIQNIELWLRLNDKQFEIISNEYENNFKHLKWKCLKDNCREIFSANWSHIISNRGCPFCAGRQVGISNCLATKNPELAKEWHPIKNEGITPLEVTLNCGKKVWWQCSKNPKHEWKSTIANRNKNGCPYCSHNLPSEDYNLLLTNPKLCEEWDYYKNNKTPNQYTPASGKKVWWKCRECEHEWEAIIGNRSKGVGCPECAESKGEIKIRQWLKIQFIPYISQKDFDGLIGLGNGNLSYDFYLPNKNLLIEYQGEQHQKYIPGLHLSRKDFEKQQEHDRRKKLYAVNNNIDLLEIWYWDYENIEQILTQHLFENHPLKQAN